MSSFDYARDDKYNQFDFAQDDETIKFLTKNSKKLKFLLFFYCFFIKYQNNSLKLLFIMPKNISNKFINKIFILKYLFFV